MPMTQQTRSARNKMMDLLAQRDHSEKEIRTKLKQREFSPEEIDAAIEYGKTNKWLPDSAEGLQALAEKAANALHRKGKGIIYINHFLKQKGLPPVKSDFSQELEKALSLIKNKKGEKAKIGRFLLSRGFEQSVVRKVVYEKL